VRRLVLMLRRTLLAQTQWAVFEPNGPALWRDLRRALESLLRGLFRAGAFAGRTEAESFFVRVDISRTRLDRGELRIDVGVAPAEPLEFILVRLRRDGDGTLSLDDQG
jgi:phage tail sheath protein FI